MANDRPYTDDDLHAEAAICLYALSSAPTLDDIRRWLPEAYVDSYREEGGSGRTWGDLLDEEGRGAVASKVKELVDGAADVAAWAVRLGDDGLEPDHHVLQLGVESRDGGRPQVRLHFAFHPDMDDAARDRLVMVLGKALVQGL